MHAAFHRWNAAGMLDLNDIRVFARVVDLRSISAAARKLGMPKSTVSRNVARLEQALGARLIQRSSRGLGLTDTGVVFHHHCLRILEDVEAAEAAVGQLRETPRGLLRVSVPLTFGQAFLGPLLPGLLHLFKTACEPRTCERCPVAERGRLLSPLAS